MLTVVIPSYNHEKYIYRCLEEAINIEIPGLKILVIDDGSVDSTVAEVKKFIDYHKRCSIKLLQKANSGLVASLNWSLDYIDTPFAYFCASDDIPIPGGVDECVKVLLENKGIKFVIGDALAFSVDDKKTQPLYTKSHEIFFSLDKRERYKACFLDYPSPILLQSTIFRVSCLKKIEGWDSSIVLDDYPLFIKLFYHFGNIGYDFMFLKSSFVVKYREHVNNSSKNSYRQFCLVKQVIERMAYGKTKFQSLSFYTAKYFIYSLLNSSLKSAWGIIKMSGAKFFIFLPFGVLILLKKKCFNGHE